MKTDLVCGRQTDPDRHEVCFLFDGSAICSGDIWELIWLLMLVTIARIASKSHVTDGHRQACTETTDM